MLTEEGIVIKSSNEIVPKILVRTSRSTSCKSCASRNSCKGKGEIKDIEVEITNTLGASVGDKVILGIEPSPLFKVMFLIYILPILLMVFGACLGHFLLPFFKNCLPNITFDIPLLTSFLFLFASFFIVIIVGKRMSKKTRYKPRIIKVIKYQGIMPS